MPGKGVRQFWLGVIAAHLVLVALGAASFELNDYGRWGHALAVYCGLTGADGGYGFFAPGVDGQIHALFDVHEADGRTFTTTMGTGSSHEATLRIGNIVDQFQDFDEDRREELNRSLSASLAGRIFGRFPKADRVTVRLEHFAPVSMKEYREGARPQWEPMYSATFAYRAAPKGDIR
jgi:hypothetical protein